MKKRIYFLKKTNKYRIVREMPWTDGVSRLACMYGGFIAR